MRLLPRHFPRPPVSILTQPGSWVQCGHSGLAELRLRVSILTQPGSWVQFRRRRYTPPTARGFNPHPARELGAMPGNRVRNTSLSWFQSSPSQGAGCNHACHGRTYPPCWFQSSPSQGAGCNQALAATHAATLLFQSSPSQGAGCNQGDLPMVR